MLTTYPNRLPHMLKKRTLGDVRVGDTFTSGRSFHVVIGFRSADRVVTVSGDEIVVCPLQMVEQLTNGGTL